MMSNGMAGPFTWHDRRFFSNFGPFKSCTVFLALIAFIDSWAFNISTKDDERGVTNLALSMIISWLWYITSLLHLGPKILNGVKIISVNSVAIRVKNTSKHHNRVAKDSWLMMRNISWNSSLTLDWLPWNSVLWICHKLLNTGYIQPPHVTYWSFFDITTTMDV